MTFKYYKIYLTAALTFGLITACEPEIEREFPNYATVRGNADFSTYVALGNSLTAGVSDSKLNRFGQLNSYPAIIADKMAAVVQSFTFVQPLLPEGLLDGTLLLQGINPGPPVTPIIVPSSGGLSEAEIVADRVSGPFNNLGIPGARVADLTTEGYQNLFFQRLTSSPNATIVDEALAVNPTFFTLWIGNNDVLGYATGGGLYLNENGELVGEAITPVEDFRASYSKIISELVSGNASIEGALANIPKVANVAYFNVVPWNAFVLESQAQVNLLNEGFKAQIEAGVREQIILAVVTEGHRRQIIPPVAEAVVKKEVFDAAVAGGADETQAQQQADTYAASDEGKKAIDNLISSLTTHKQPEQVHAIVEQQLGSNEIQESIRAVTQEALAADADPERELEEVIGKEGALAVRTNFNSTIANLKAAKFYPTFNLGANGFVVESETSPTGIIQLTENSRMLLTFLGRTMDEFNPAAGDVIVPDYYALDQQEFALVNETVNAYNEIIANIADEHTFALVSVHDYLDQIKNFGITEDGITFTADFLTGNTFSLDGVHLTQRGYALVAKKFIQTINSYYGAQIPLPNVSNYPAIALPQSN